MTKILFIVLIGFSIYSNCLLAQVCVSYYSNTESELSSFNEVKAIMARKPYDLEKVPVIPITMWRKVGKYFVESFVARRSKEILMDRRDFRKESVEKPIHSMGVGLVGHLEMFNTRWSGVFAGGNFPILARASISQGNPYKIDNEGNPQKRSTAMAIKIFGDKGLDSRVVTANAVFQNDLNGLLKPDGSAINFLESSQTNQPNVDFSKVKYSYEWLTLIGVAVGSFRTPKDRTSKFPFINPQIRPVHSLGEFGVEDPKKVKTPTWVKINPRTPSHHVSRSDFRLEVLESLRTSGELVYDVFASDYKSPDGEIQWVAVGKLVFNEAILSEGVDKNLLFHHDSLNSKFTKKPFEFPEPSNQYQRIPEDIQ